MSERSISPTTEPGFSDVLDAIGEGVFILDAQERFRFANRQSLQMWGRRADEVVGRHILDVFPNIENSDPYRTYRLVLESQLPQHLETQALAFGGRWIGLDVYPAPGGAIVVAFRDIEDRKRAEAALRAANELLEQRVAARTSELRSANAALIREIEEHKRTEQGLKESEERHRKLYNRTPMALQSVDADARLLDVNDHWLQLFGYTREKVVGRSPAEFMTEESAHRYRNSAWPEMLKSVGSARSVEYQFVKSSGDNFDGRLSACGEFEPGGRFIRSWSVIADITAEKAAEAQLRRSQRMDALGQLTSGVAHDFNNLLTSVIGNLEMLERRLPLDERASRFLTAAREGAERGARLTSQLLAFSRSQRMVAAPTDLNQLVMAIRPLLESTIGATVRIDAVLAEDLWPAIADASHVELVLLNLIINARDASALGGAITIETGNAVLGPPTRLEEPPAGDYVMVAVADTGEGIPADTLDHVFEPFFTTKEIGKGSGLGLSQVLGVAQQLGGGIGIETKLGRGTVVKLYLPRASSQPVLSSTAIPREPPGLGAMDNPRPAVILLVDDDEDVRGVTATLLGEQGHEVIEAAGGRAALLELERHSAQIELLVIDFAMPEMNGVELARLARRSIPGLPVLFITGLVAAAELAMDTAPAEILQKPFGSKELRLKVASVLQNAQKLKESSTRNS